MQIRLHSIFQLLDRRGSHRNKPDGGSKNQKGTRIKERAFLSESELRKILDALKQVGADTTHPVIYFMLHTGCKVSEALSLTWEQIEFDSGFVNFHGSPMVNGRRIQLSSIILNFLTSLPRTTSNVFTFEGNPWPKNKFNKILARHRSHVDLGRDWDTYAFRHTFAYHFLRNGRTLQQLQVVLGHRNIADTMLAYGSIVSRDAEKVSPYAQNGMSLSGL